ncbi:MAG: hypothetical protein WDN46_18935 [Methylocella sp.]
MSKGKSDAKNKTNQAKIQQSDRFTEAARELGCDEDESHFDEKLKKVARHTPTKVPPVGHEKDSHSEQKKERRR